MLGCGPGGEGPGTGKVVKLKVGRKVGVDKHILI